MGSHSFEVILTSWPAASLAEAALAIRHPNYCPDPVPVRIAGSTWGGSMLKLRFIGRGMHLEFCHPTYHTITTSRDVEIRTTA